MAKPVVHATYLLNLGSENRELVEKSMDDIKYEIEVCNRIGVDRLVLHPGSNSNREIASDDSRAMLAGADLDACGYTDNPILSLHVLQFINMMMNDEVKM